MACMVAVTDIHVPSLSQMVEEFQSTEQTLQMTLTLCCLGFLLSSPLIGSLSDTIGRRRTLLMCVVVHVVSSVGCYMTPHLGFLFACRILQGAAAAGGPILAIAITADSYRGERFQQITALIGMVITFSLALAPVAGGYIGEHFGWRVTFLFVGAIVTFATFLLYIDLPETLSHKRSLALRQAFEDYKEMVFNWRVMGYGLLPAILIGTIIAYVGMASYYFVDVLGMTQSEYGYFQGAGTLGNALFCLFTAGWVVRFGARRVLQAGMTAAFTSVLLLMSCVIIAPKNPYLLTVPLFIFGASIGMTFAPATHKAIEPYLDRAGTASAFLSCLRMLAAVIITYCAGILYSGQALSLGIVFSIFTLSVVGVYLLLERRAAS